MTWKYLNNKLENGTNAVQTQTLFAMYTKHRLCKY